MAGQEAESRSGGWAGVGRSGSCSKTGLQLFCLSEREEKIGGVCWVGVDEVTVPDGGFFSSWSKWAVCPVEREKRLGRKSAGAVLDCDSDSCFLLMFGSRFKKNKGWLLVAFLTLARR